MAKANCYDCQYRGNVPGSCHSSCDHPSVGDPVDKIMGLLTGGTKNDLNIRGNVHGIRSGWFMWPLDFDPVWLENCDGFTAKESGQ